MKKKEFVLNFHDDSLEADGIKCNLQTTISGHFKIPPWYQKEINLCVNEMSEAEQIKTVKKLPRLFRHQSEKVTEDLMRRAEVRTPELKQVNQNVVKDCEIRNRYKKTCPRPVVSLPLATDSLRSYLWTLKLSRMDHCILSILLIKTPKKNSRNCGECLYNKLDSK